MALQCTIAQVASYPFDDSRFHKQTSWTEGQKGLYSAAPDDDFFRLAAALYASGHPRMSGGDNCGLQVRSLLFARPSTLQLCRLLLGCLVD